MLDRPRNGFELISELSDRRSDSTETQSVAGCERSLIIGGALAARPEARTSGPQPGPQGDHGIFTRNSRGPSI